MHGGFVVSSQVEHWQKDVKTKTLTGWKNKFIILFYWEHFEIRSQHVTFDSLQHVRESSSSSVSKLPLMICFPDVFQRKTSKNLCWLKKTYKAFILKRF